MATKKHTRADTPPADGVAVKGSFRLTISNEDGSIAGDSGWHENIIVQEGFASFMAQALMGAAGSSTVSYLALGTGTVPAAADTSLNGEITGSTKRITLATASATASTAATASFTGTFQSTASFLTAQSTISNIGLYAASSGSNLFAGNTYASSPCSTNQNVNCTYTIVFHS